MYELEKAGTKKKEEKGIAIPVTIGFVSDHEKTRDEFITDMLKRAGKFNRSDMLTRERIDSILQFDNPKRIAVFRLKPSYWIDSDAYVKGVLLGVDDAKAYVSLMPDRLKEISLPKNVKFVLLEIDRTIKGEEVSIENIRSNPEKFDGKQVVIQSVGAGVNISVNQVIEKALKEATKAVPELAPAAAAAEANPVDVLVQAEARWYPTVPSSRYQIIPAVGAMSYDDTKPTMVETTKEINKVSKIYGYIVTGSRFGFDFPVIVVQDKKFVGIVSEGEIKEDIKNAIEEIKEKIRSKAEEDIKAGSGIVFGERIEEIKERAKILNVENPKIVEAGRNFKIAVSYNEQPVEGATVTITKRGIVVKSGKTDANGLFITKLDEKGVYVITATKEGYRSGKSAIAVVSAKEVSIPRFVHVMPVIEPEKPEVVRINRAYIEDLKLKVRKAVEDVVVDVKELRELPKDVKKPQGKVCVYIEINVSIESDELEEGEIKFNVSKEWLLENNLNKHSIKLKKYVDGGWITLDTEIVGEDDRHVYYVARTPGFSIYAIVGEETAKPATTQTPTSEALGSAETETIKTPAEEKSEKTPGFEILSGLLAGGMALALRRRI
jgi:PGF-pre-PGF domain-containing protein